MNPLLVVLFLCVVIAAFITYTKSRPYNFPPGPTWLPLWGSYWILLAWNFKFPHKALAAMSKKIGDPVLGFYLSDFPTIAANDYLSCKEMLEREEFQGRPDLFVPRSRSNGHLLGVLFTEGQMWSDHRRFSLRNLREFGFGRRWQTLEEAFAEEVRSLVNSLRGDASPDEKEIFRGDLAFVPDIFHRGFLNAFLQVLTGERLTGEKCERLRKMGRSIVRFQRKSEPTGGAINLTPWLRYLAPENTGFTAVNQGTKALLDFLEDAVEENRKSLLPEAPRGLIDVYLLEIEKRKASGDPGSFNKPQMMLTMFDYLFASANTGSFTMASCIRYLVNYPEKADIAFNEILSVIGRGRLPSLDDRPQLPYTQAFLLEVMRHDTLFPLVVPRRSTNHTTFRGYFIPKGTLLLPNLWAAHRDPKMWPQPDKFKPERFLSKEGQLTKDQTMPFGRGRRLCPGETFSRQIMFLLLAALIQNFTFTSPASGEVPKDRESLPGFAVAPRDFWVKVSERP